MQLVVVLCVRVTVSDGWQGAGDGVGVEGWVRGFSSWVRDREVRLRAMVQYHSRCEDEVASRNCSQGTLFKWASNSTLKLEGCK